MDCMVTVTIGCTTVRVAELLTAPTAAVMLAEPMVMPLANPDVFTVATDGADEVHVELVVTT